MNLRHVAVRSLSCLPCALLLLAFSNARAAHSFVPDGAELLYIACLASVIGGFAGLLAALLAAVDHVGRHHPWRVAAGVALLGLPFAHALAQYSKLAEGLRARNIPIQVSLVGYMAATLIVILLVWAQQRFARTPRIAALTALPLVLGLAEFGVRHGFTSLRLALLLAVSTIVVMASTLGLLLQNRPWQLRSAAVGAGLVLGLALTSLAAPQTLASGRRRVVVRTSGLAQLDRNARIFGERHTGYRAPSTAPQECTPPPAAADAPLGLPAARRRNVVLISIDTVRADDAARRIGGKPVMPNLHRFRQRGWSAPFAITGYPATMMALSSAFSGVVPSRLLLSGAPPPSVFGAARGRFDDVSAVLPRSNYFNRPALESYLFQGATRVVPRDKQSQTKLAIDRLKKLRKARQSHLLWVHYFEPHEPYARHEGFDFGGSERQRYRSELAYTDRELGKLLAALEAQKAWDDTLVIVFADHGESFGEHGHLHHHYHLYPWLVRVPFALHVPGQAPRKLAGPVHLTDIAATVLDYAGIPAALPLDGQSLLRGDPAADRLLISEEFPIQSALFEQFSREGLPSAAAVRERIERIERGPGYATKVSALQGTLQSVVHTAVNVEEVYRLDRDPGAKNDLADREPALAAKLREALDRYYARVAPALGCVPRAKAATLAQERD
jgi:hypothetical protein